MKIRKLVHRMDPMPSWYGAAYPYSQTEWATYPLPFNVIIRFVWLLRNWMKRPVANVYECYEFTLKELTEYRQGRKK